MMYAEVPEGSFFDENLPRVARAVRKRIVGGSDDAVIAFVGHTGSGKSNLSMWFYEEYAENVSISQVALNKDLFREALLNCKTLRQEDKVILYDELDLNRRASTSKWNRDFYELYSKIRGVRILHLLNYPSLDMIDRAFVKDRINGVFLVVDKSKHRPRKYYYYSRQRLSLFFQRYGSYNNDLLRVHAPEFAMYCGGFRPYQGGLLDDYEKLKAVAMNSAIDDFAGKHGGVVGEVKTFVGEEVYFSPEQACRRLRMSRNTIRKVISCALAEELIPKTIITPLGRMRLREEHLPILQEIAASGRYHNAK
jgi:hypothetical protein